MDQCHGLGDLDLARHRDLGRAEERSQRIGCHHAYRPSAAVHQRRVLRLRETSKVDARCRVDLPVEVDDARNAQCVLAGRLQGARSGRSLATEPGRLDARHVDRHRLSVLDRVLPMDAKVAALTQRACRTGVRG